MVDNNPPPPPPGPPGCGLKQAAFCDTFDEASPGGRGGDLDDANWSVARIYGFDRRGALITVSPTTGFGCGKTIKDIVPPNDIFFCAGGGTESMHMNDVEDDYGGFTIHSYRIRKPFDWAGRTGVLAFDVGGKGILPGGHGIWFNITIADQPIPAPYQQGGQIALFAKNAVIIEFEAGGASVVCKADGSENSISTIYIEKDYKLPYAARYLFDRNPQNGCWKTVEEVMNHIEIHLSTTRLEVWASDAGEPDTFRMITHVDKENDGFELPFTRGYVNLQQTHYNAAKSEAIPSYATYHWDNIAFDGPQFPTPRAYEVPDSGKRYMSDGHQVMDLGYELTKTGMADHDGAIAPVKIPDVDVTNAESAEVNLNIWAFCPGESLEYRFNGGTWRSYACPFPLACADCENGNTPIGSCDLSVRAVSMPVDPGDLKQGENTFELRTTGGSDDYEVIAANIELQIHEKQ